MQQEHLQDLELQRSESVQQCQKIQQQMEWQKDEMRLQQEQHEQERQEQDAHKQQQSWQLQQQLDVALAEVRALRQGDDSGAGGSGPGTVEVMQQRDAALAEARALKRENDELQRLFDSSQSEVRQLQRRVLQLQAAVSPIGSPGSPSPTSYAVIGQATAPPMISPPTSSPMTAGYATGTPSVPGRAPSGGGPWGNMEDTQATIDKLSERLDALQATRGRSVGKSGIRRKGVAHEALELDLLEAADKPLPAATPSVHATPKRNSQAAGMNRVQLMRSALNH